MAIKYDSITAQLYERQGGVWVLKATTLRLYGMDTGSWLEAQYLHRLQSANRATDTMNYQRYLRTDKFAPRDAPISLTLTQQNGTLGRKHVTGSWTNPSFLTTVDGHFRMTNNSDHTKDGTVDFIPLGGLTSYQFLNAGQSGDSITVDVWYSENGATNPFESPTATANLTFV